jgi:hypothetical protein
MTKTNAILAAGLWGAFMTAALTPSTAHAQTFESERHAHPRLAAAIDNMKVALAELESAPDDFGGRKARAVEDTRRALHSLRAALYWRVRADERLWERY